MTQTIEQLTARVRELEEQYELAANLSNTSMDRVRELEAENARLKDKQLELVGEKTPVLVNMRTQLAASQLHAEQLRRALETLNKVSNIGCGLVEKALAIPRDTNALDAYVSEKVKEYQERLADALAILGADSQIEAEAVMLNYKKQVSTLTRQRDLAVEAITRAIDMVGHPDNITYLQQTLDAIKESEGK